MNKRDKLVACYKTDDGVFRVLGEGVAGSRYNFYCDFKYAVLLSNSTPYIS